MLNWGVGFWSVYDKEKAPPAEKVKIIPLQCPNCGAHTDAEIRAHFITHQNKYVKLPATEMGVYNYFLRCTRCNSAILLLWSYGEDWHGEGVTAGRIIFPLHTEAFDFSDINDDVIPEAVLEDIRQAELSYFSGAFLGAGMLLRRACQNICRDKNIEVKGNLVSEINNLVDKGIITKDMAEMAHTIRIIGNEIAHPNPKKALIISRDDVRICREFINQLVQVIYINPFKAKVLQEVLKDKTSQ